MASLGESPSGSEEVFAAFEELDALPVEIVRSELGAWLGPAPRPDDLQLRTLAVVKDADVLDLGPVAEEQLRLAGKSFDGVDMAPEERLDGEIEGSFAGALQHRVLVDAAASGDRPLFDVLLYAEDAGVVFRAGTTELIGMITYGSVEMSDRRARAAIQQALAPAALAPAPVAPAAVVEAAVVEAAVVEAAVVEAVEEIAQAPAPRTRAKAAAKKAPKKRAAAKKKSSA